VTKNEQQFVDVVWLYYKDLGRHDLPWRKKAHQKPYDILVSEVMLQQTQVPRVVPKYQAFLKRWPSARALANAPLGDVLRAWQGLGYNSRAKRLWECAQVVTNERNGRWPRTYEALLELPGIGPYTAAAVMAFAYNEPVPLIETNVRTVYIHHFFNDQTDVADKDILRYVSRTIPDDNPREWYAALMDYGTHLKQTHGNNISKSKHYKKQSTFKGSDRQIRGTILRALIEQPLSKRALITKVEFERERTVEQLRKLEAEGLVVKTGRLYRLP
jgi:A/G-specific adenine glycosylase